VDSSFIQFHRHAVLHSWTQLISSHLQNTATLWFGSNFNRSYFASGLARISCSVHNLRASQLSAYTSYLKSHYMSHDIRYFKGSFSPSVGKVTIIIPLLQVKCVLWSKLSFKKFPVPVFNFRFTEFHTGIQYVVYYLQKNSKWPNKLQPQTVIIHWEQMFTQTSSFRVTTNWNAIQMLLLTILWRNR
jgi:hypothetical protein